MFVKILPLMPVSSARTGQRPHSSLLAPLFPAGQYSQPKPHQTHNPNEGADRNQRTTAVHFKGNDAERGANAQRVYWEVVTGQRANFTQETARDLAGFTGEIGSL